jgi:hypothetical protein
VNADDLREKNYYSRTLKHKQCVYLFKLINSIADEEGYFHIRQIILSSKEINSKTLGHIRTLEDLDGLRDYRFLSRLTTLTVAFLQ